MTLGLRIWGVSFVVAVAGLGGCKVDPDENPGFGGLCYELQGNLTCQSLYNNRPYCSVCTTENQGCVMQPPATVCLPSAGTTGEPMVEESDESSTGTTTAADTTVGLDSTGSTTGELPCEAEGEVDPGCMALDPARPFCVDAACVGCEGAGGDEFCAGLDELTPACDVDGGACLGCGAVEPSVCGDATPVCGSSGACTVCTEHAQCPGTACHLGPDDPLVGRCFLPEEVIWIDNSAPCPGLGTQEEPACSLQNTAASLGDGDVAVLRIAGGVPYAQRAVFSGEMTVALIGVGGPVIIGGNPAQQAATLLFNQGVTGYIQGISLMNNPLTHGLMCSFSDLRIQDSQIRDNAGWGVFDFDPCTLDVERTTIAGNEDGGLRISGGQLRLVNSVVGVNGLGGNSTGIRLLNAEGTILYNTIAGNDGSGSDSIECVNATGALRNNIITGLQAPSIELDCFPLLMENNAMDAANFASGTNVAVGTYNEIYFDNPAVGDFGLSAPPLTPYGDVALWVEGDPEIDADGTHRPTDGSLGYAGVDEP